MTSKKLKVSAINNGTVIDHILPNKSYAVAKILQLEKYSETVTIASNVVSEKTKKKDIVKIENRVLSAQEVSSIALISPEATVNIIKNYEVIEKGKISLPDRVDNIIPCTNPLCITNHEDVGTRFRVEQNKPLLLRCEYCERTMDEKDVERVLG